MAGLMKQFPIDKYSESLNARNAEIRGFEVSVDDMMSKLKPVSSNEEKEFKNSFGTPACQSLVLELYNAVMKEAKVIPIPFSNLHKGLQTP